MPDQRLQPDPLVERIRETVGLECQNTSLRRVARQVAMTPSGLSKFLSGSRPLPSTLNRLRAWYIRSAAQRFALDQQDALAAMQVLTVGIPEPNRRRCMAALASVLNAEYGRSAPSWLPALVGDHGDTGD